jgi:hypothetical protein
LDPHLYVVRDNPEKIMKKHFAIGAVIAMALTSLMVPVWGADTATDTNLVKLQSASIAAMRQSIASAAGYELKTIELKHTAHQLTVTIVNSKHNGATSAEREKEAIAMTSAVERGIAAKPEFEGVEAIHIDYVSRVDKKMKTVQIFDFFRSPANVFVLHKT